MALQQPMNSMMQGGALTSPLPPLPPPTAFSPYPGGNISQSLSQSVPVSSSPPPMPPITDLPPPHMLAPMVYRGPSRQAPPQRGPGNWNANYQNNFYNQSGGWYPPYYPQRPGQYQQQQQSQPPVPQQAQQQAAQPPAPPPQQPPTPPKAPEPTQPPQQPPAAQKPEPQQPPAKPPAPPAEGPSAKLGPTLDDATVKSLNERLNNGNSEIRGNAAMDFYKLLEANPAVADDPQYKPYVDAFLQKILSDPSSMVRQPAFLAFETDIVKQASDGVRQQLQQRADTPGGTYDVDQQTAQGILGKLASNASAQNQQFQGDKPGGTDSPAAPPEAGAASTAEAATPAPAEALPTEGNPAAPIPEAGAASPGQKLDLNSPPDATGMPDLSALAGAAGGGAPANPAAPGQQLNIQEPPQPAATTPQPQRPPTVPMAPISAQLPRQGPAQNPTAPPLRRIGATQPVRQPMPAPRPVAPMPAGPQQSPPGAPQTGSRLNVMSPTRPQPAAPVSAPQPRPMGGTQA